MQGMLVSHQADPHIGADAANDLALMVVCCMGADILGPFPKAIGGCRYLYIAIDKFTKWPKITPVVKINKQYAVKFINSINYRFEVLNMIITDNGSQFTSRMFQEYCKDLSV
jgi:transposase InsO family protein